MRGTAKGSDGTGRRLFIAQKPIFIPVKLRGFEFPA
jgi:hypothetical protein